MYIVIKCFIIVQLVVFVLSCMSISVYIESNDKLESNYFHVYTHLANKADSDSFSRADRQQKHILKL